jgi:phosphomannomutase
LHAEGSVQSGAIIVGCGRRPLQRPQAVLWGVESRWASGAQVLTILANALFEKFMKFESVCFKAYDIRGVVPIQLNEDFARALGRAFGAHALSQGQQRVAVGRDGRLSGPALAQALMDGLRDAGVDVIDVGMVTTPMLYFAAHTLCESGIQVTGSHNPKDYNGFKMVLGGRAIYGEEIQGLHRSMEVGAPLARRRGAHEVADVGPAYLARIVQGVRLARPLKLVVDAGNGVAGASAPAILRALGCEVTELFCEVDGDFPNHHPDPSKPENLKDLIHVLAQSDAELGLAFDGDGDRLGVITKAGETIYPDRQMVLFAWSVRLAPPFCLTSSARSGWRQRLRRQVACP